MDRSWINSRLFSKPHLDGVNEFMTFVSERFDEDAEILCPCRKCLTQISGHKGQVEDHLYIYGMASTYTRWIHHGEPFEAEINESVVHLNEQIGLKKDVGMNEQEEDDHDDRLPDMVKELFNAEDEGQKKKSMFATILEEMKKDLYPGAAYTRFSFVVKLLHIKSFYRISNVAFDAILTLYEPEESEDIEEGAVDKVSENVPTENMTGNISTHSGRSRVSKRVVATDGEDQPNRVTRQRTRISAIPQDGSTEDVLIAANSPTPAQPDDNLRSNDGDRSSKIDLWNRKITMGRDLDRISRGLCTKLPVEVVEGKRRPLVPLQAAKLASEAGITLRQHFPILPRWKDYKDDKGLLKEYIGRLGAQFNMDTNSEPVKAACYDLLKCAQRQVRYKLKMAYFNGIPANEVRTTSPLDSTSNEQWQALVDTWSEPKHKNKCVKAKSSRENVQYQQKTGSRSYIAHCHAVKQKKYKDVPPTAIDLFKECHCSSKTGFTETVKDVIANMESIIADPVQEGQSSKTPIEVISQVMPRSKFLQNIGLESSAPKRSGKTVVSARVEELEAQLEAERQGSLNLKGTLDSLMQKVDESEAARVRQLEEFENLKNSRNETTALLRRLIGFNTPSSSQP